MISHSPQSWRGDFFIGLERVNGMETGSSSVVADFKHSITDQIR
jgi:hypothetical protein